MFRQKDCEATRPTSDNAVRETTISTNRTGQAHLLKGRADATRGILPVDGGQPFPGCSVDIVDFCEHVSVAQFRRIIWLEVKVILPTHMIAPRLRVYADMAAYTCQERRPLETDSSIGSLGGSAKQALIDEVPWLQSGDEALAESRRRRDKLMDALEWKEPTRLCRSAGNVWPYQGAAERGSCDSSSHAIGAVLSGPGTGKSRMVDEMKSILCAAAEQLKDQTLVDRMKNALVFSLSFGNDTPAHGAVLDFEHPEYDISYRMLYQLSNGA